MQTSKGSFHWNVSLNKGDNVHPICVVLNNGAMQFDLQIVQATKVWMLLVDRCAQRIVFRPRSGQLHGAEWLDQNPLGVHIIISTQTAEATLSEHSATMLADKIDQAMCIVKRRLRITPDPQSVDSPDGPMHRMNNNLRSVFG